MFRILLHTCITAVFSAGLFSAVYSQQSQKIDYHQIPDSYKSHPEYGVLKFEGDPNTTELIHLRTKNSRTFKNVSGSFTTVSTAGTFHYKDDKKRWVSIQDEISRSSNNEYGIFQSELPIKINYLSGKTEMMLDKKGKSVVFGENSSLQFLAKDGVVIENSQSNKSMGEPTVNGNQILLKEFLPGLNRVQETQYWSVRTDYFIEQKLNLPANTEFLQISDELKLPYNWKIEFGEGEMTTAGWNGNLTILNEKGIVVSTISRPLYYDSFKSSKKDDISSHLGVGAYKITKTASGYTIKLLVPASWFNQENLVYPLVIDPTTTNTYAGNFAVYDKSGFNASCEATMNLNFPPTGGYQVTGTNTSYRMWAKGYQYSSGTTDSYADKAEQRSRVGSLNGWTATQSGVGSNFGPTNTSYYTAANNGYDYNMVNQTIANGCYTDRPTIPYQWQGFQTFFPVVGAPAAGSITGCSFNYQELVTNTWIVTATYNSAVVVATPTTVSYPSATVCKDVTSVLATQTGTTGGVFASTTPGLTINASTGEVNPSTSTAGTYTVTYSVGTAPCNQQSTAVLSVLNAVTPTFTQIPAICSGGFFTLPTSSTNSPAVNGSWSPAPNNNVTTLYTFTPFSSQCTSQATMTVTVNPTGAAVVTSNSPVCTGGTLNLSTTASGTYNWTGPNGFTSTNQNPTILIVTSAAAGTYVLTMGGSCPPAPGQVTVVVNETPVVAVTKTDILCNGLTSGTATATATPAGAYTYSWSPSGGSTPNATNLAAGTYTVTVANGTCTATGSATITEPTLISLTTSTTQSSCGTPTGSATVVATGGTGAYTYSWSPSGGTNAAATGLVAGAYTVTVTDGNGCVKTANVAVSSSNGPTLNITSLSNVTCFGSADGTATISATGGTAPYTFVWSPSGGSNATATNLNAGAYIVTVTDFTGCSNTINVSISESPVMNVSTAGTATNCGISNGTATANASGGNGSYTYLWLPGGLLGQTQSNLSQGTYSVTVTDGNGCSVSGAYVVGLNGTIPVNVTPSTITIDEDESINLFAATTSTIPGITYSWTPSEGLSCIDCPNPIATPIVTTTYIVTLTSPDGCIGQDSVVVNVRIKCGEYFIPTIFSPNGDGNNDEFRIFGKCIEAMDLKVYDRWGEVVFESTEQQYGWDGTYKGQQMNPATFIYSISVSFIDGRFIKEKGNINLVR